MKADRKLWSIEVFFGVFRSIYEPIIFPVGYYN